MNSGTVNSGTVNSGTVNSGTVNSGTSNPSTVNRGTVNRRSPTRTSRWFALLLLTVLCGRPVWGVAPQSGPVTPSHRVALLVAADSRVDATRASRVGDSRELAAVLRSRYGFGEIVQLYGPDATGGAILRSLTGLQAKLGGDSALIVSISLPVQLGASDLAQQKVSRSAAVGRREDHYWVPSDGRAEDPYSLILVTDLVSRITEGSRASSVLGFLDTCLVWANADPGGPEQWLQRTLSRGAASGIVIDRCPGSAEAERESFLSEISSVLTDSAGHPEGVVSSDLAADLRERLRERGVLVRTATFGRRPDFRLQPTAGALEPEWRQRISRDDPDRVSNMNALAQRVSQEPWASREPLVQEAANLLLEIAGDPDEELAIRQRAVFYLGRTDHEKAATRIIESYDRLDVSVREIAITSLSRYTDPHVARFLEREVDSTSSGIRRRAIEGLAQLESKESLPTILRQLPREGDDQVTVSLLNAVMTLGADAEQAFEPVAAALRRDDAGIEVQRAGIRVLSTLGDPRAEDSLIGLLGPTEDVEIRRSAAFTLGRLVGASDRRFEVLAVVLGRDPSGEVRQSAAVSLSAATTTTTKGAAVRALISALEDDEPIVRAAAAESLGKLGDPSSVAPLERALRDDSSAVRSSAAVALGEVGVASSAPALIVVAQRDEDLFVRKAAEAAIDGLELEIADLTGLYQELDADGKARWLRGIGQSTNFDNYALALDSLRDTSAVVREAAVEALAEVPSSLEARIVGELERLVRDPSYSRGAVEAVVALGMLRSERAAHVLVTLLENGDRFLLPVILQSLGGHTNQAALDAVDSFLDSEEGAIRSSAARAMGRQAELVFQRDGETGRALDRLSRALEAVELSDPLAEGQLLVRAGHILAATGDLEQAQERFFRALDVLGGARDRQADLAKAEALKGLAEVGRKTGDVGQAEKMLLEALALEEAVLPPGSPELATAYERISSFYREIGNESAARYYAERAGSRPR